jgi:hypothetical protein
MEASRHANLCFDGREFELCLTNAQGIILFKVLAQQILELCVGTRICTSFAHESNNKERKCM